jgi:hypothetical protein
MIMANGNHEALDDQIALLRRQIANLTEEAAAASGAGVEEALTEQITEKQERLDALLKQRGDAAAGQTSG